VTSRPSTPRTRGRSTSICRRGSRSVPRSAPTVRPRAASRTVAPPAGRRDIRLHHRVERLDPAQGRTDRSSPHFCNASSTAPVAGEPAGVISLVMALLSFVESAPRAHRLKVGNADLLRNSTEPGHPLNSYRFLVNHSPELQGTL